jgi:hypothetical protein
MPDSTIKEEFNGRTKNESHSEVVKDTCDVRCSGERKERL